MFSDIIHNADIIKLILDYSSDLDYLYLGLLYSFYNRGLQIIDPKKRIRVSISDIFRQKKYLCIAELPLSLRLYRQILKKIVLTPDSLLDIWFYINFHTDRKQLFIDVYNVNNNSTILDNIYEIVGFNRLCSDIKYKNSKVPVETIIKVINDKYFGRLPIFIYNRLIKLNPGYKSKHFDGLVVNTVL